MCVAYAMGEAFVYVFRVATETLKCFGLEVPDAALVFYDVFCVQVVIKFCSTPIGF